MGCLEHGRLALTVRTCIIYNRIFWLPAYRWTFKAVSCPLSAIGMSTVQSVAVLIRVAQASIVDRHVEYFNPFV